MARTAADKFLVITGLLMLGLGATAADQLFRWGIDRAARVSLPAPLAGPGAATDAAPIARLGPAMAIGARHRLDRRLAVAAAPIITD
jgi:hypothetical protein